MIKYSKTNLIVMADSEKKKEKQNKTVIKYSDRNLIIMKYSGTNNKLTFW